MSNSTRQQQVSTRRSTSLSTALNLLLGTLALSAATLAPVAQAGELDPGPVVHSIATREQVRAEWEAAQRSGDFVVNAETGLTAREADPVHYAPQPHIATKTRKEVRAETLQAIRSGDIVDPESGRKLNELYPQRYKHAQPTQAKGQVAAIDALSARSL